MTSPLYAAKLFACCKIISTRSSKVGSGSSSPVSKKCTVRLKIHGLPCAALMVGYRLANTLSESGAVARGICVKDDNENLTSVVERTHIERIDGVVKFKNEDGSFTEVDEMSPVSMNMWGFTPDYFEHSDSFFVNFLKENADNIKAEFFIPLMVNELINNGTSTVKVLDTPSK